jgi:putative MATE family efflux protein
MNNSCMSLVRATLAAAARAPAPRWRRFLAFLGPLVLTNVLQALAGTLNNIYLGQLLGAGALAAAVTFFPLLMFCIAFVIGLGAGASALIGQAWGAKQPDKVRQIAGTVVAGGALLGTLVGLAGIAGIEPLLRALRTPTDILPAAVAYARVTLLGLPAMFVYMLAGAILRGVGDSLTPLRTLLVACVVTMTLTPALILGWIGLPPQGATSAAWANVAGAVAALAWLAWHLARKRHLLAVAALGGHLRLDAPILRIVARLGVPTGLFFVASSLADIALLSLVNTHGSHATAAWGAVSQVMAYVQFPAMSIAIAASVFAAQALGAGELGEVDHATRVGLGMNLLLTGGLATTVALAAPWLAALFTREQEVVTLTAALLRITVWGSIFFGMASVFTGVMRSAGTVRTPTLISLGCLAFLLFPLGWLFHGMVGIHGIWFGYPLTYATAFALQGAYFYGAFKRRPMRRLV